MHLITLSFDDGFINSNLKIAELYEKYGFSATFNIVANLAVMPNEYMNTRLTGDISFPVWNELQRRGHEIMPHGYEHENYQQISFDEGKSSILNCLKMFSENLQNFDSRKAIFNFPYNASTPELREWLPTIVRAYRDGGDGINALPNNNMTCLHCTGHGPGNCEEHLESQLNRLLKQPEGWLIYNTHGLDDEGWGPISANYLDKLLDRLTQIPTVKVVTVRDALSN